MFYIESANYSWEPTTASTLLDAVDYAIEFAQLCNEPAYVYEGACPNGVLVETVHPGTYPTVHGIDFN